MCSQSAEYSHMLCVLQVDSWQKEQLRAETSPLAAQAKPGGRDGGGAGLGRGHLPWCLPFSNLHKGA